jgi:hypothetical protein
MVHASCARNALNSSSIAELWNKRSRSGQNTNSAATALAGFLASQFTRLRTKMIHPESGASLGLSSDAGNKSTG